MRFAGIGAVCITLTLILSATTASAHHSFASEFDSHQPVTFTGKVTKVEWMNPHIYFYVDAASEPGQPTTHFIVQGGAPNMLYRLGWRRDSLKPGDQVTVFGFKARDGWNRVNARDVTLSDGRKVFAGTVEPSHIN